MCESPEGFSKQKPEKDLRHPEEKKEVTEGLLETSIGEELEESKVDADSKGRHFSSFCVGHALTLAHCLAASPPAGHYFKVTSPVRLFLAILPIKSNC